MKETARGPKPAQAEHAFLRGVKLQIQPDHFGIFETMVPDELDRIIRESEGDTLGVLPGEILLDASFTRESMVRLIRPLCRL